MAFYMGIDAGGSKTDCAIADETKIVGRFLGETCKLQRVGRETATASLQAAVRGALRVANANADEIHNSCIGISGASQKEVVDFAQQTLSELLSGGVTIVGDNVIAHEAAFSGGPGVLIIAGTGSIAYGRNEQGEIARAGGWGPVVSDEGSGDWIGRAAVNVALQTADAGMKSAILSEVQKAWGASSRDDIVRIANGSPMPNFAALFPQVLRAAEEGDAMAVDILNRAGEQLAKLGLEVVRRLWPDSDSTVQVAGAGGVVANSSQVRQGLENVLRRERPAITYRHQVIDPVHGALYLARHARPSSVQSV